MSALNSKTPTMRPYLPATAAFAGGTDSPRGFLERCLADLEAWEPRIGAFVTLNLAGARAAADASTVRWRAGRPLSPIDGMPVGIKDIIETIDMPTENGSPLFEGYRSERDGASVAALREAGAIIVGKTVTTEFACDRAARHPQPVGYGAHARRLQQRLRRRSRGRGDCRRTRHPGVGSILRPASFCGCFGFKPTVGAINRGGSHDGLVAKRAWHHRGEPPGGLAGRLRDRAARGRRSGFPGLYGPADRPRPSTPAPARGSSKPTAGPRRRRAQSEALVRAVGHAAGRRRGDRHPPRRRHRRRRRSGDCGRPRSVPRINAWESRWPINTYRSRDAGKLSRAMLDRGAQAEAMTLDDYRACLADRERRRAVYRALAAQCDAGITLSATGAAPLGLGSTGDPVFVVPGSMLGVPALSLPLLQDGGLPLGLQLLGFADRDADLFATAAAVLDLVGDR